MKKISKRQLIIKKLSRRSKPNFNEFIKQMRKVVKQDPGLIKKFKEYKVPIEEIDEVHVEFCDLDVSAKTKDTKIYLNKKLLDKYPEEDPTHYLIHELVHYLQQKTGKNTSEEYEARDYLDRPSEEEAFETQVEFKKREEGEEEAEEYIDGLLDFHDIRGKERKEKKEELLD